MNYLTSGNDAVDRIGMMNLTGNIIPQIWYKTIVRDILVYETVPGEGNSYNQIQDYFKNIWNLSCCRMSGKHEGINGRLREHYQEVREKYPEAFCEIDWFEETIETESIELCTNPLDPYNKQPQVWDRMVNKMKEADNIVIQTPYVICNQKMYGDLKAICSKSVKTELIINAVESGANPFGCTDYLNQKKAVRQTGREQNRCAMACQGCGAVFYFF